MLFVEMPVSEYATVSTWSEEVISITVLSNWGNTSFIFSNLRLSPTLIVCKGIFVITSTVDPSYNKILTLLPDSGAEVNVIRVPPLKT